MFNMIRKLEPPVEINPKLLNFRHLLKYLLLRYILLWSQLLFLAINMALDLDSKNHMKSTYICCRQNI